MKEVFKSRGAGQTPLPYSTTLKKLELGIENSVGGKVGRKWKTPYPYSSVVE